MKTAERVRQEAKHLEEKRLTKEINNAAACGCTFIYASNISKEMIEKLRENGFVVSKIDSGIIDFKISWEEA